MNTQSMLRSAQIRAARALLGWTQQRLATASKTGLATIARIEQTDGPPPTRVSTILRIQATLERAGIRFLEGDTDNYGVMLDTRRSKTR